MGVHKNIDYNRFPKQGNLLNKRCRVFFNYDLYNETWGTIVRDDIEEPNVLIIKLDDGRYVLATECQFSV